ncbi:hypothetical protein [Candidatus Pelagibacter sp.]|uniref:hypothetical protein n=1 Tax=Candidatus Pelagibacter sp. TaxID=2024849 RepID=UPI003F830054
MNNKDNFYILDCTLRDGGYYNNWNFSPRLIQDYLNLISKTDIKYVELGFRGFIKNKNLGLTGYTDDKLINKLKFPNYLRIGVMINASDLYKNNFSPLKNLKRLFPKINKKIFFVRFACHAEEVFGLKDSIDWLLKKDISVFVNIMQVSELELNTIKKICIFLKEKNIRALYFADSLGALEIKKFKKIIKLLNKNWNKELGLHAHDNLKFALKNSEYAIKNNFKWIDSTIMGMGRGPGNLKTEEIIKKVCKKQVKFIDRLKNKYFHKLMQKYKWGTNRYYKEAAKKKIHPTYIQNMLADERYKKSDYDTIIKSLANEDAKKFNPHKLFFSSNIYHKQKKGTWLPSNDLTNKNILILGPGKNAKKNRNKLINFINNKKLFVIALNTIDYIPEKFINSRTVCHPKRIILDHKYLNESNISIIAPISSMPEKLKKFFSAENKFIFDYGLHINGKKKIFIYNNYCSLPKPLSFLYSLAIAISAKANRVYIAGFDGHRNDDPFSDETAYYLKKFSKSFKKIKLTSLTKSKYNLPSLIL